MRSSESTPHRPATARPLSLALLIAVAALGLVTGCPKKPEYPVCDGDKDCKDGEFCVDKKCVQCRDNADCPAGQECQANACVQKEGFCNSDVDCSDHKVCKDNQCVACQSDDECAGGRCSDGACLRPGECVKDEDCEDDEDCVNGRCQGTGPTEPPEVGCKLETIFFDFDTSRIREDARGALEANAECLKSSGRAAYAIGHTDPRGTDEYNIALSDGRARAVADYLSRLGIDPARLQIVPKGESEASGTEESSWEKDRRVEFEWK